jgi:hypothetical protein
MSTMMDLGLDGEWNAINEIYENLQNLNNEIVAKVAYRNCFGIMHAQLGWSVL